LALGCGERALEEVVFASRVGREVEGDGGFRGAGDQDLGVGLVVEAGVAQGRDDQLAGLEAGGLGPGGRPALAGRVTLRPGK